MANLHFQLSWYIEITLLLPPTQHHSFFRNFHPLFFVFSLSEKIWISTKGMHQNARWSVAA